MTLLHLLLELSMVVRGSMGRPSFLLVARRVGRLCLSGHTMEVHHRGTYEAWLPVFVTIQFS